ncbi:MAG: hypothetical protein NC078_08220, partial [Ruminococcus sp.]|nr:hypothetical protein [Ruminococcus sp.]
MLISYIMDKDGFRFLYELLGGKKDDIPEKLRDGSFAESSNGAAEKLRKQGYIHICGSRVDVERTVR